MLFDAPGRATDRQLRQFALALVAFVTLVIVLRWSRDGSVTTKTAALAAFGWTLGLLGLLIPGCVRPFFSAATAVTRPVGMVVSELMLALLYFGVITPLALASRLMKRDRLRRRLDRDAPSYWLVHRPAEPSRYFRQS